MKLTNHAGRALGIPGARRSVVVQPKQSVEISTEDLAAIKRNKTSSGWLSSGLITVDSAEAPQTQQKEKEEKTDENEKKEPSKPSGVPEVVPQGRGWYKVFVAGIEVSQGNLRLADAEALAAQYNTD